MSFQTPNSNKVLDGGDSCIRQSTRAMDDERNIFEPSPTIEHLRTRDFKTPTRIVTGNLRLNLHRDIVSDLEDKQSRRGNQIYHPFQSRDGRANRTRNFKESIRDRKNDKVEYSREYMDYKVRKQENERIMNEIARNMSLSEDDFLKLEQSIDAILGFSDDIYDAKARPRHFEMVDEYAADDGDDDMIEDAQDLVQRSMSPSVVSEELLERELEEMLRLEEEELEYLTRNLTLN